MRTVQLVLVGGFLGAGKTTLLWSAARRLAASGRRVGLITNDQAPLLVDTGLLAGEGLPVQEVAGSCFCCNFPGLLQAAFRQGRAEVGHVKALVSSGAGRLVANLTRTDDSVQLRGRMDGSPKQARLILNVRVQMPPRDLEALVRRELAEAAGATIALRLDHLHCLSPGRPQPTYRYTHIT